MMIKNVNIPNSLIAVSSLISAIAAGFSAYYAFAIHKISNQEWESKSANVLIQPSIALIEPNGLFSAFFINTSSASQAVDVISDFSIFRCKRDANSVFPEKFLIENFYSRDAQRKKGIHPAILSVNSQKMPEKLLVFRDKDLESVKNGKEDLYFVAQATYKDGIGNEHEVRYCQKSGSLMNVKTKYLDLRSCPIFNCVGEDCDRQKIQREPQKQEQKCELFEKLPEEL